MSNCQMYLQTPLVSPDILCCAYVSAAKSSYGSPCYCDVLLAVDPSQMIDMKKACALPTDCGEVGTDMSKCTSLCSGASSPAASAVPPPGFAPPTVPTSGSNPSTSASGSSGGTSSLPVPLAATIASVGGMSLAVFIIWLIMSRCRIHVKWDMNAPCWCCYRRPKPQANEGKPDIYN